MNVMVASVAEAPRWELYRLLGEPRRLRLLGLTSEDELSIGELAELTGEAQPNVSKHLKQLREAGLVSVRRQGTRAFARLPDDSTDDPVLADAVRSGRELCARDGSLQRVPDVIRARDAAARAFFDRPAIERPAADDADSAAYLTAVGALLPRRHLAVDIGTGEGALLSLLAPLFERVVAVDRSEVQLDAARARLASRGYANVELLRADYDDSSVSTRVAELGGADAVFAARLLHHAPKPEQAVRGLAALARPGGRVIVIDYGPHEDETMRETQADLWLGFDRDELLDLASSAGLIEPEVFAIPAARYGPGPDAHLQWQVLSARRPDNEETRQS
jgi:ArsR family transcriptional regulator